MNIYEVFLLSWPLAERMERYLLLNHLRSVTPRWSYLSDLTQISNPKFSRDGGRVWKPHCLLKMIQCIRKNAQDSEAKITLQVQFSIWWRECQLSREWKEPDQAAPLLSFHASHPTLWAEQEDPLVPTGAVWQLPPRPPSGHSWVENASKAEAEHLLFCAPSGGSLSHLITLNLSVLWLTP